MIDFVTIDNFATIRHISFDLGKGFNVITGETGAGSLCWFRPSAPLWETERIFL